MRFVKRQIRGITIRMLPSSHVVLDKLAGEDELLTVYARETDAGAQLLGVELVNTATGEVTTMQIQLSAEESYYLKVTEVLEIQ